MFSTLLYVSPAADAGALGVSSSSSLTVDSLASFVDNTAQANGGARAVWKLYDLIRHRTDDWPTAAV